VTWNRSHASSHEQSPSRARLPTNVMRVGLHDKRVQRLTAITIRPGRFAGGRSFWINRPSVHGERIFTSLVACRPPLALIKGAALQSRGDRTGVAVRHGAEHGRLLRPGDIVRR
jgi:hypothetical protein